MFLTLILIKKSSSPPDQAEELVLGDLAWQESLNSFESRILWRRDLIDHLKTKEASQKNVL